MSVFSFSIGEKSRLRPGGVYIPGLAAKDNQSGKTTP